MCTTLFVFNALKATVSDNEYAQRQAKYCTEKNKLMGKQIEVSGLTWSVRSDITQEELTNDTLADFQDIGVTGFNFHDKPIQQSNGQHWQIAQSWWRPDDRSAY